MNETLPQLGFLFLTRGEHHNSELWEEFFKDADTSKYKLFIHSKDPKTLISDLWKNNCTILKPIPTSWGNITIVKATLCLLNAANNNPYVKKFILLSEFCIPMCDFNSLYQKLLIDDNAYINWNFGLNIDRLNFINSLNKTLVNKFNTNTWAKQSQWMILDKKHVHLIFLNNIKITEYLSLLQYCPAADEHFFINFLIHCMKCDLKSIHNRPTTFVDWSTKAAHPRLFISLDNNLIEHCKKNDIFFARKFNRLNLTQEQLSYLFNRELNTLDENVSQTNVSQTNVSQTNVSQTNVSQTNVSQNNEDQKLQELNENLHEENNIEKAKDFRYIKDEIINRINNNDLDLIQMIKFLNHLNQKVFVDREVQTDLIENISIITEDKQEEVSEILNENIEQLRDVIEKKKVIFPEYLIENPEFKVNMDNVLVELKTRL